MTIHVMDEAETLCKRMGIMVNGEFVCLEIVMKLKKYMDMNMKLMLELNL